MGFFLISKAVKKGEKINKITKRNFFFSCIFLKILLAILPTSMVLSVNECLVSMFLVAIKSGKKSLFLIYFKQKQSRPKGSLIAKTIE